MESSSGNNPIRVDTDLKYNPSTNRLTAGSFAGDGSALTGVESFVTGMIVLGMVKLEIFRLVLFFVMVIIILLI